ncbi:MAG: hypothetical protein ACPGGA_11870, partial [Balneolaceae bacterium]
MERKVVVTNLEQEESNLKKDQNEEEITPSTESSQETETVEEPVAEHNEASENAIEEVEDQLTEEATEAVIENIETVEAVLEKEPEEETQEKVESEDAEIVDEVESATSEEDTGEKEINPVEFYSKILEKAEE